MTSLILSSKPVNFLAATKIPPPASPAKISPAETFSEIHENAALKPFQMILITLRIPLPALDNTSPKPFKLPAAFFNMLEILVAISEMDLEIPSVLKPELRDVKKSPIDAVIESNKSARPVTPPPEKRPAIAFATTLTTFLNISKIENTPLKVRLSFSAVASLIFNFSVKLLMPAVILYNCLDVAGGNISLNA